MTRPYSKYRDSDVEWLGSVPEHWKTKRLKLVASINDNALSGKEDPLRPIAYVDIGSVSPTVGITQTEETVLEDAPSRARRLVKDGDTIISTVRTYLRAISPVQQPPPEMVVSTGFAVVRPRQVAPHFASWALREFGFVEEIVARSTGVSYPAINSPQIGNIPIPIPPLEEQQAIAGFLDRETNRVDAVVAKNRQLIERLEEYRMALITRTVIRGLPPKAARAAGLDPSPRHRDSGVEWLGEIPEHWEVARLKWSTLKNINGVWGDEPDGENDIPCIRVADFDRQRLRVDFHEPTMRAVTPSQRAGRELTSGDLLLEKSGGGVKQMVGCVVLYDHDEVAVCSNFIARISTPENANSTFWVYVHAALYSGRLNYPAIKQTTGIQNLDAKAYFDTTSVFSPLAEQEAIAAFLDRETERVNVLCSRVETAIERLLEYRTALVSAAVTGKIDVRDAVPTGTRGDGS